MTEISNYFNYFTEIEEHFQRARGTSLFLLSPIDWALIESWKNGGVPLEAVLRGIDIAFEKWRTRRSKVQQVNSLAFCAQAVLTEAQRGPSPEPSDSSAAAPFATEEIDRFLQSNLAELDGRATYEEIANDLRVLIASPHPDLEQLDQSLTVLEQKMIAITRSQQRSEDLLEAKRDLDTQLRPYRSKMTAPQLDMLERQFLERRLLEMNKLPRLSLFYIR